MAEHEARWRERHPEIPFLHEDATEAVAETLRELGVLSEQERIRECRSAGEGNMNVTLRVVTDRRSVIVKQSRPWVEKYPQIEAPFDRAAFEARFYRRAAGIPGVGERMPELLAHDEESRVLVLEDLGEAKDFTDLYAAAELGEGEARALGAYLRALHEGTRGGSAEGLENRAMRRLNWEHVFDLPLRRDNGLDLDVHEPGLQHEADRLKENDEVRAITRAMGERYLADGPCLVHGDFFPGSWLRVDADRVEGGVAVIDPEFCFFGDPELDWGVLLAHLAIAGQPGRVVRAAGMPGGSSSESHEEAASGGDAPLDAELVARFAGIEIVRRLLGVAQLPLPPTSGRRADLLERAVRAICDGRIDGLFHEGSAR